MGTQGLFNVSKGSWCVSGKGCSRTPCRDILVGGAAFVASTSWLAGHIQLNITSMADKLTLYL
jgi:hypothetical protein